MAAIPIYQDNEDFFVPFFEVKIGNRGASDADLRDLPEDVIRDVMQVTYKDKIDEIDSFEITVNNWDAADDHLFEPGRKVRLIMGYRHGNRNERQMLDGEITTVEPTFPESGPLTMSVRGLNVLHSLKKKQHTFAWEKKRDSDIAKEIGANPLSDKKPGLNIEVRIDQDARNSEPEEPFVFMNNQYDILFLIQRARVHGYTVYLDMDGKTGKKFLYFGPSQRLRNVTYKLEWGRSMVEFKPTITTTNQVSQVTVRGWNRRTQKPIEGVAKLGDKGIDINTDQAAVASAVQDKEEIVADRPVENDQQAKAMAKDILLHQLKEMVKCSGATVGLPDLRAGRKAEIAGTALGPRLSGEYFIVGSTHIIGDSGYRTTFTARRERPLQGGS
jgi:phage protein D